MPTRTPPRLEALEPRDVPATFVVTNTDDDGTGSLRRAITDANNAANTGGPDRIEFNIPGAGVHTIRPDLKLPNIEDPVVIDGYSQPGSSANTLAVGNNAVLRIEINGANAGETNGLVVFSPDTTIRGLVVNGFRKGQSSTAGRGIAVTDPAATNVVIAGNFVGTNAAGTAAVPNENIGVFILTAPGVRVGGPDPADRNVISGNGIRGVFANAPDVVIQGNYVGTTATGVAALPNTFDGVFVAKNTGFRIGGPGPGEGNVIAGNGFTGITLNGVTDSFVQGNLIGVGADGTTPLGNGDTGLFISPQAATNVNNLIGGPGGAGNTIAFSGGAGITVLDPAATGNRFQSNRIFENAGLGIDLGSDGPTANDAADADAGANGLQNAPVLGAAALVAGATRVTGTIDGATGETFRIELFSVPIADAAGGEGQTFLGAVEVAANAAGVAAFQVVVTVPVGTVISSTATRLSTQDTSEFSNTVTALPPDADLAVTIAAGSGAVLAGSSIAYTVTLTTTGPATVPAATLVLTLPALDGVTYTPAVGAYDPTTGAWTGLNLAAGATAALTVAGTVPSAAAGVLTAVASAFIVVPLADPDPTDNVAAATTTITPPPPGPPAVIDLFAVGSGPGIAATVEVFNADGSKRFTLHPYGDFAGGVAVGTGDLTGDGIDDIVTGAGPDGSPHVKVFDGATGAEVASFFAYDGGLRTGVFVGLGDVTGDGRADIITGAGPGGAPHVKVFDGRTLAEVRSFFAFDAAFRGGVSVRAGDVDGDGRADVVTGAGPGAAPHVKVFAAADLSVLQSFFAADPSNTGGVFVGVADLSADRRVEVVAGLAGRVKVFGSSAARLPYIEQDNFTTPGPTAAAGPSPVAAFRTASGIVALLIGAAPGTGSGVSVVDGTSNTVLNRFSAFDPLFAGGAFVG